MVLVMARDRDQSKVVFNYIGAILNGVPALQQMIERETADEIELANGITIAVKTTEPSEALPSSIPFAMKSHFGIHKASIPTSRYSWRCDPPWQRYRKPSSW